MIASMIAIGLLFVRMLCDYFKSRRLLEAEIVILRHQLNLLQRRAPRRPHLRWVDRALFIWLYRRCPGVLRAITIVRPETVVRWHRMGFAAYWRWKSRSPGGRPRIAQQVRDLIRRMSLENPLWGATKIHGELLKLGIEVAQSTVSIYMVPRSDRPLQTWKTFLSNHVEGIASIDLFVVPTIATRQERAGRDGADRAGRYVHNEAAGASARPNDGWPRASCRRLRSCRLPICNRIWLLCEPRSSETRVRRGLESRLSKHALGEPRSLP